VPSIEGAFLKEKMVGYVSTLLISAIIICCFSANIMAQNYYTISVSTPTTLTTADVDFQATQINDANGYILLLVI
jgi:hypothetical protein